MSYPYWAIQFLSVDRDCISYIKQLFMQLRVFHSLTSIEVSNVLRSQFKGCVYKNRDEVIYKACTGGSANLPFIYKGARIITRHGTIDDIYYLYLCDHRWYHIYIDFKLSGINPKHIKILTVENGQLVPCLLLDRHKNPIRSNQMSSFHTYTTSEHITCHVI